MLSVARVATSRCDHANCLLNLLFLFFLSDDSHCLRVDLLESVLSHFDLALKLSPFLADTFLFRFYDFFWQLGKAVVVLGSQVLLRLKVSKTLLLHLDKLLF